MLSSEKETEKIELPEVEPWAQLPAEPLIWFSRFEIYRRMGANRSLLGAVRIEYNRKGLKRVNKAPNAWILAFNKWRWLERAEAFTKWEIAEEKAAEAEERKAARARRRAQLDQLDVIIGRSLKAMRLQFDSNPNSPLIVPSYSTLVQLIKLYGDSTRAEFGDTPEQILKLGGAEGASPINIVIKDETEKIPGSPAGAGPGDDLEEDDYSDLDLDLDLEESEDID